MIVMTQPRKRDDLRDRFLDWLRTPKEEREPSTQKELAEQFGVEATQLSAWKRDPDFLERWNTTYLRTIGSPETKGEIMATLRRTATDQDDPKHVQAAKAYFEIEGSLRPASAKLDISVKAGAPSELTDEELQRLLAMKATDELAKRRDVS